MILIVGLGNPGRQYENTRHNIGFMVIDKLEKELVQGNPPVWQKDEKKNVLTVKLGDVLLVKPQTFMNNSGYAVRALMDFYKLVPDNVWVVHDDIDLPLGKIKVRAKGASAGHKGVESILRELKSDSFVRFRLGIGRGVHSGSVVSFVLSRFRQGEAGDFKKLIKYGVAAVRLALKDGIDRAMNRYN